MTFAWCDSFLPEEQGKVQEQVHKLIPGIIYTETSKTAATSALA